MSNGAAKGLDYFNRGSAAYERLTGVGGVYLCPLCGDAFARSDLERNLLTLEHVPPRTMGGRHLCLICRRCNSSAGHKFDSVIAELDRLGRFYDALRGRGTLFAGRAHLYTAAGRINARISYDENGVQRVRARESQNNPKILESASGVIGDLVVPFKVSERDGLISLLRAGFLAAFAYGGYRFALDSRLDGVRRQIMTPEEPIIPTAAVGLIPQDGVPASAPFVGSTTKPIVATAVCMTIEPRQHQGAIVVLMPHLIEGEDFYERLPRVYVATKPPQIVQTSFAPLGWPNGPKHQWDHPENSADGDACALREMRG